LVDCREALQGRHAPKSVRLLGSSILHTKRLIDMKVFEAKAFLTLSIVGG
jgi:hypothetical protein